VSQDRYLAIRHDGKAIILEGEYGEHYQYAERVKEPPSPIGWRKDRYDTPDDSDTHMRYILRSCPVHGPSGRFRLFLPSEWTSEECDAWLAPRSRVLRIGPALNDPHQTDRSRQIERHYHGV
jgi:hypothetical protein